MDVRTKYNSLIKFERIYGILNPNRRIFPVHKPLKPKIHEGHSFGPDISEYIEFYGKIGDKAHILDAGCGNGHTLKVILENTLRKGTGISISNEEIITARKNFAGSKLEDQLKFICQSYDDALVNKYDIVIAVESLKHSPDLKKSILNISGSLNRNGKIIIVEDLARSGKDLDTLREIQFLKEQWALNKLYTEDDYRKVLNEAGLKELHNINLTDGIKHRKAEKLRKLIRNYRILQPLIFIPQWKRILNIFLAGFIYEDLYAKAKLEYRMLIYQKI